MEENLEANENGHNRLPAGSAVNRWLAVAGAGVRGERDNQRNARTVEHIDGETE